MKYRIISNGHTFAVQGLFTYTRRLILKPWKQVEEEDWVTRIANLRTIDEARAYMNHFKQEDERINAEWTVVE